MSDRRSWPRRDFLKAASAGSAILAAGTILPRPLAGLADPRGRLGRMSLDPAIVIDGTDVRTLAM